MEGLIPMAYKAIKRSRTRKQYNCLSSGAALSYNVADLHVSGGQSDALMTPQPEKVSRFNGLRRHRSVGGHSRWEDKGIGGGVPPPPPAKQLVRFRSHRLFSCVTAA